MSEEHLAGAIYNLSGYHQGHRAGFSEGFQACLDKTMAMIQAAEAGRPLYILIKVPAIAALIEAARLAIAARPQDQAGRLYELQLALEECDALQWGTHEEDPR